MKEKKDNILKHVLKYGIYLFREEETNKALKLQETLKEEEDFIFFTVQTDSSKRIAIKNSQNRSIGLYHLSKKGDEAYQTGKYDTCIESYRPILDTQKNVGGGMSVLAMVKIGLSYMQRYYQKTLKQDLMLAIDYLTIAQALSKDKIGDFHTEEINSSLEKLIFEKNRKFSSISINDFKNSVDFQFYKTEIKNFLLMGSSLEEACKMFGLNEESQNILSLLYAMECYEQENFEVGDLFLESVRENERSYLVTSLLIEVKRYRKKYPSKASKKLILKS